MLLYGDGMYKRNIVIIGFVITILFLAGCTNQDSSNLFNNNQNQGSSKSDLKSIIQLTDFTNDLDHKYSSISGNGQKIIYAQYPTETYPLADTEFTVSPHTLWVTDTSGSKVQTEIFDGWEDGGLYAFYGDTGGTPVLNYDATYAYFGVRKYINYIGYYWLPDHNPDIPARIRLSDNSFESLGLIQHGSSDFTWLMCFRLTSDNVYCLVTFSDKYEMGTTVKGVGFVKMDLDGENQEFIYTNFDLDSEDCPRTGYVFFIDETYNRLYYQSRTNSCYYYLDLDTYTTVKINNEEIGTYWLRGVYDNKLIFAYAGDFFIYGMGTGILSQVQNEEDGSDSYTVTSDKIFYCLGSGLFSYTDYDGDRVSLIGMDANNFSDYNGRFTWDIQFIPTNGKAVSEDGTKLLVKEMWQEYDNPNYYVLKLGT